MYQPLVLPHILELLHRRLLRFLAHVLALEGAASPLVSPHSPLICTADGIETDLRTKPRDNMAMIFLFRFSAGILALGNSGQLILGVLFGDFADVVIGESPRLCFLVDGEWEI